MGESRRERSLSKESGVDVLVRSVLSTGNHLADLVLLELRTGPDSAEEAKTNGHDAPVDGVDKGVVDDVGGSSGVLGVDVNESAGEGLLNTDKAVRTISRNRELGNSGILALEETGNDLLLRSEALQQLLVSLVEAGEVRSILLAVQAGNN